MTVYEAIVRLQDESGHDAVAGKVVAEALRDIARAALRRVPPDVVEDVIQDCVVKILAGRSRPKAEQATRSYLRTMIVNRASDLLRQRGREYSETPLELDGGARDPADRDSGTAPPEVRDLVSDQRKLLDELVLRVQAARLPRYRAEFELAWNQIRLLVFEERDIWAVLEATGELAAGASSEERKKAQQRALTAHKRARLALGKCAREAAVEGSLTAEQLRSVESTLENVLKRVPRGGKKGRTRS